MTHIYKQGDLIPHGDLIKAYILHWLNFNPHHSTAEVIHQWHGIEKLMRVTLNEQLTIIPKFPGLENVEIEA